MNNDKLLLILIILVGFGVLIDFVTVLGLAMLSYEVKPLISKVESKMDSLEMPDFSSVNELMMKVKPLLELANLFNDPMVRYYFKEGMDFFKRFDGIQGSDLIINGFPGWSQYYSNESWRSE